MPAKRKIIQLLQEDTPSRTVALCDDGTVWYSDTPYRGDKAEWQLGNIRIPQDGDET